MNILGVGVHAVDQPGAVELILKSARQGRRGYVCFTGVHGVIESQTDRELRMIHNRSLLTVPDGMPLVWCGRVGRFPRMGRVYGPDLMREILRITSATLKPGDAGQKPLTHFFFGTTPDTLDRLVGNLKLQFPGLQIAGTYAPPFGPMSAEQTDKLTRLVAEGKPDFFWVGLSTPRQEQFMAQNLEKLDATIMLGVGAAFDILAGVTRDAPAWMKRSGLQWLFRLFQEPRRLWKRYVTIVPVFGWKIIQQGLGWRQYRIET